MSKKKSLKSSIDLISTWSCSALLWAFTVLLTTVSSLRSALIGLLHDRIVKSFKLLLFVFKFAGISILVRWNPSFKLWDLAQNNSFVFLADLFLQFLIIDCVFDIQAVTFEAILGFNFFSDFLVLLFVFFSILDELVNFLFWKSAFVVCDCDFSILRCSLVSGCDIHDTIFINFKSDLNLWNSSWSWWNAIQIEASKLVVVFSHRSFTFEDLDKNTWLIISVSCKNLRFFGGNGGVSFN